MTASIYLPQHCHFQVVLLYLIPNSALWEAEHVRLGLPSTVTWARLNRDKKHDEICRWGQNGFFL